MRIANLSAVRGFMLCLFIVVAVSLAAAVIKPAVAKERTPTEENYADLAAIKENQKILAKNRDEHQAFMSAKLDNERLVTNLTGSGWSIDWSAMDLVASPSFQ